ncbi:hypothetical protein GNIT_3585 [Glaciecola nitratireducens FR1064]|uniref:Uncharacterized protein n=2 Tax=Brumicola TaxID=3160924 RepID=G4QNX1_GLANF|nr:hypothetical protein GNIT_3585 [Glaciecola nitratireducens FR1064]
MTSFSRRHKVLAAALATVFVGSGTATAKAMTELDESEPLTTFRQAYKEYITFIKTEKYSPYDLVQVAKQTYQLGKVKFGSRHPKTFMLQQNLANAYLEAGEYSLSAFNYEAVLNYLEETQGDESQAYYFALLDIINLLQSANNTKKLTARDLGIAQFGNHQFLGSAFKNSDPLKIKGPEFLNFGAASGSALCPCARAIDKLLEVTEELVTQMPENSLMFRGHTVRTAVSNSWTPTDYRLINVAKRFNLDAKKIEGEDTIVYIESLTYLGQAYFWKQKNKEAMAAFDKVLALLNSQKLETHPIAIIAHAHLVSLNASKKEIKKAVFHSQELAKNKAWVVKQTLLHRVSPKFPSSKLLVQNKLSVDTKSASVSLTIDISAKGQPVNIRVKKSTHCGFEKFASDAVKQWFFVPKFTNDEFVVVTDFDVTIDFIRA